MSQTASSINYRLGSLYSVITAFLYALDDGFAVTGQAREIEDPEVRQVVRQQLRTERDGVLWPDFDRQALFELLVERCLLTVTSDGGPFPKGSTIWKAG